MSAPDLSTPRGTTVRYLDGKVQRTGEVVHVFAGAGVIRIIANVWHADPKNPHWRQPVLLADECEVV